jgi:hypothetical protein
LNASHTFKGITLINQICLRTPLINNTLPHLFYTNAKTIEHNKIIFKNTLGQTFTFHAKDICSKICPPHFKLPMVPSQTIGLHHELSMKKDMLIILCARNYITLDGLVNGVDNFFKDYR